MKYFWIAVARRGKRSKKKNQIDDNEAILNRMIMNNSSENKPMSILGYAINMTAKIT